MSEKGMNLYTLGKSIMAQAPILTQEELVIKSQLINNFFNKINSEYYMLLCKEISYYTIFKKQEVFKTPEFNNLGVAVLECLKAVGDILNMEITANKDSIEIWVRTPDQENLCMFLFDCAPLVVSFGGYKNNG